MRRAATQPAERGLSRFMTQKHVILSRRLIRTLKKNAQPFEALSYPSIRRRGGPTVKGIPLISQTTPYSCPTLQAILGGRAPGLLRGLLKLLSTP